MRSELRAAAKALACGMGNYQEGAKRAFERALELVDKVTFGRRKAEDLEALVQGVYDAAANAWGQAPPPGGRFHVNKTKRGERVFGLSEIEDGIEELSFALSHLKAVCLTHDGGPLRLLWWGQDEKAKKDLMSEDIVLQFDPQTRTLSVPPQKEGEEPQDPGEYVAELIIAKLRELHRPRQ